MRKYLASESGAFNPRVFLAFLLSSTGLFLAMAGFAASPSSGTLTDVSGPLTYSAGPFNQPNQSPAGAGQLDTGPRCGTPGFPCDSYLLTVTMPTSVANYPNAAIKVSAGWIDTGTSQSDYDLYVFKGNVATTNGNMIADYQSASGANPEVATIFPVIADGTPHQYTIKIVPYTPSGETVNVKVEFFQGTSTTGGGGNPTPPTAFGGTDPTVVGNPRYMNFYAPKGSAAESSSGEFNIGYNPKTGRIMVMNQGPVFRITPAEKLGKPECCEGLWEDKSAPNTTTGLDPILWTDQVSGRTFVSNSTAGANGAYAFSDDDGDTYIPVGGAPPNGADHQTIATGPYPAALSILGNTINKGQYVLYCSQDLIGANCQRSDDQGSVYGPAIVATGPGASNSQGCGGLHGHVRVAPDGTAYLPDKSCGSVQGGALTLDAGNTPWTEFQVKKTVADAEGPAFTAVPQADGADPSIGIDKANTVYYCYVNNESNGTEGHVHCAVGKRNDSANPTKINWIRDTDVGAIKGVVNAAHPETVAGDAGRAACGFFGTNVKGDYEKGTFPGVWYVFIATTYDEGKTWVTVNATPNDPIQSMTGIWQKGGSGDMGDRNLLDFNEITMDEKGRVLYGYSDGCTSPECVAGTAKSNLGAYMRVARQSGGRTLLASFDGSTDTTAPITPKAACLNGTRDSAGSHLTWKVPDNGGADITAYNIYRGTTTGAEAQIGTYFVNASSKPEYTDVTADPTVRDYFYKIQAVNSAGQSVLSNEVDLQLLQTVVENVCQLPGLTVLTDAAGDSIGSPSTDLLAFHLAQPMFNDGIQRLVFTINTDPNPTGVEPAGTFYYVAMKMGNGSTPTYKGVRMVFNGPTPTFESYTPSGNSSGTVDGRFVAANSSKPAESTSSYAPSTGTITIVVKLSDLGFSPGSVINGFVSGVAQPANPSGVGANAVALYDQMPNSLAYTGSYVVGDANTCGSLQSAVSRKTHGATGNFDVPLPLTGTRGIECRTGGSTNSHTLVLTFDRSVIVTANSVASVSPSGGGAVAAGPNTNQITVNLGGIPNAQHITVTLGGIQDAAGTLLGNIVVPMDVLFGDVNASGRTDTGDVTAVRNRAVQVVDQSNFRFDVNTSGRVDTGDVTVVRSASVSALP